MPVAVLVLAVPAVVLVGVATRRVVGAAVLIALVLGGGWRSGQAWDATRPDRLGPYAGWATVIEDPTAVGRGVRVVLEIEGERFRSWVYGGDRHRIGRLAAGDRVVVDGERRPLAGRFPRSAQVRHVVGEFAVDDVADAWVGPPLARASNRVRELLRTGAERAMDADRAALFTGLVVGDDTRQSDGTTDAFRTAGLGHLTAVSGQNVSQVIGLASVVLARLPRTPRLAATLGLIGWFVVITRAEPSILRAGTMAGLAALAVATGRERAPVRTLMLAVIGLLVVDPLLLWSVGFWLSSGATVGVVVVGPWLERRLGGPRWLAAPVAVTLGAQAGVVAPSLLVFGGMPALGVPANLLAVPVAGLVMVWGLPAGILAAVVPPMLAGPILLPATLGTAWVDLVARVTAGITPTHPVAVVASLGVQAVAIGWLVRARGTMDRP